jgi:hypothetical protein
VLSFLEFFWSQMGMNPADVKGYVGDCFQGLETPGS